MASTSSKYIVWGLISGVIIGVGSYLYFNIKKAMDFDSKISGFKLISQNSEKIVIGIDLDVTNKSDLKADITGYDFDVFINDNHIAKVNNTTQGLFINANSTSKINLPVEMKKSTFANYNDFSKIYALLLTAVANAKTTTIKIKGKFTGKLAGLELKDYPLDIKYTLYEILS